MQARIETELARRLRQHRAEDHPACGRCGPVGCCQHCGTYFDIARRATLAKTIYEGTLNIAHSWLSVREPVEF